VPLKKLTRPAIQSVIQAHNKIPQIMIQIIMATYSRKVEQISNNAKKKTPRAMIKIMMNKYLTNESHAERTFRIIGFLSDSKIRLGCF
jgi:hypothetical protein